MRTVLQSKDRNDDKEPLIIEGDKSEPSILKKCLPIKLPNLFSFFKKKKKKPLLDVGNELVNTKATKSVI